MLAYIAAGSDPNGFFVNASFHDLINGPCGGGSPITMSMSKDIKDERLVRAPGQRVERLGEELDELSGRPVEAHRVEQIIELDTYGNGGNVAFRKALQIRQVIIEHIAMPGINGLGQQSVCIGSGSDTRADSTARALPNGALQQAGGALDSEGPSPGIEGGHDLVLGIHCAVVECCARHACASDPA